MLLCALGRALTKLLLLLAPRYGRSRAGFEELHMSLLLFGVVYIALRFFLVHYEHSVVVPTYGVLSLSVNRPRCAGSLVQDKPFGRFM